MSSNALPRSRQAVHFAEPTDPHHRKDSQVFTIRRALPSPPISEITQNARGETATYSDTLGGTDISQADLDINTSAMAVSGCAMMYSSASNGLYLASDNRTSWSGPLTPGSSGARQNRQCKLYGTGSAVSTSGTQLTMTVSLSFAAAFFGTKGAYLWAYDSGDDSSGPLEMGNWTVTAPPAPDLTIAESHAPISFSQLQSGAYTITVSNSGNAATNGSGDRHATYRADRQRHERKRLDLHPFH